MFNDDKSKFESICKIHHVGSNYFAVSGFDDGGLLKAANKALQQNADIDMAIKSFGTAMTRRYQELMNEAKLFYPDQFKMFLHDGLGDVSFFGFYNGEARIVNVEFLVSTDKSGKPVTKYRIKPINNLTVIGISKDITSADPEELPTKETREQNPQLYVEELVEIEARKHPMAVSEPIDLLKLQPDGPVWIRKNETASAY